MKPINATERKLSEQFADFIDLTDENLEEINVPEFGKIQGGSWSCGWSCGSCFFSIFPFCFFGSCDFGSCSCWSCGFGSCSCGSCGF